MNTQKFNILDMLDTKDVFSEINGIYERYNATNEEIELKSLNALFSKRAVMSPNNIAVIEGENKITYRELDEKSNKVANYLIEKGVTGNELVGIYAPRKINTIVNVLGILKAGCAYVPIDMEYPQDRVDYIISNSKCRIVLKENIFDDEIASCSSKKVEVKENADNLAYVIYTSGSTGVPKGVQITHRAAANTILDINKKFGVNESDRIIALSSLCFDLSVYDIFGALFTGASLVQVNDQRDVRNILEICKSEGITIWNSIPSTMNMLVDNIKESETSSKLRLVLLSGDWISLKLPEKIKKHFENSSIVSLGGATEAAIWSIYYPVKEINSEWRSIPYGMPLANQKIYILNFEQKLCPEGIEGEIYIGGAGVAEGYCNDPEKTKAAFIDHKTLGRLYRTGDYGILKKGGYVEFVGRKDNQVKIRGYRIELGEVEAAMNACEEIDAAIVVAKKDSLGSNYLCGYYIIKNGASIDKVKLKMRQKLPPYMIPSKFIKLESVPLTPNGKIDRKNLPESGEVNETSGVHEEISDEVQAKLVKICNEVFGNGMNIGVNDNFFELGIDSILTVNIITKIEDEFNVQIKFKEFLKQNNITELAGLVRKSQGGAHRESFRQKDSAGENLNEPFPISDVQMAYLMGRDSAFELGGVSTHAYGEMESQVDIQKFNDSLQKVIDRHPVLRSVILPDGTQKILEGNKLYKIDVTDYSGETEVNFNRLVLEERSRLSHHVFKTDEWPLFNFKAFKTPWNTYHIFIEYDLLIGDGMSVRILISELYKYYSNPDVELEKIKYNFRDYMLAVQEFKKSEAYKTAKKYWLDKIDDFPAAPALTYKKDPSQIKNPRYSRVGMTLDNNILTQLRRRAKENSVTLSALLCTAFSQVLAHWSNQPRHAVNLTVFNRYPFHQDVEKIIGDFTSTMLIDVDLTTGKNFWENCSNVQGVLMEALENRYYNGIEFIREIAKRTHMENKAIMPVVFTSMIFDEKENCKDYTESLGKTIYETSQTSQVFLDYQVSDDNGVLKMSWDYVEQLLDEKMVNDMFDAYVGILKGIAEGKNNSLICSFALPYNTLKLVEKFNSTKANIKSSLLHKTLYTQAKENPQRIAVKFKDEQLTYEQLNQRSNQIARFLMKMGVSRNDFVVVLGNRCPNTIANIMGVLKAGAAYVPVDPSYPKSRIDYIMSTCGAKYLLGEVRDIELESYSNDNLPLVNEPDNLAYVIFTSGSTGTPKGVKITHASAYNTIFDINKKFGINKEDRFLGVSSMSFDLSVYDIFGPQLVGATLVQTEDPKDINSLVKTLLKEKITVYNSVPAIMELITDNLEAGEMSVSLKLVMLSGDCISMSLPEKIKLKFPNATTVSLGGATEASIWSIYHVIDRVEPEWTSIPYGTPLSNQTFYVFDYNMELCPVGVQGELYIGGDGVAAGYLSDDKKANKAFIEHEKFGRLYRTGDFGVLLNKGYIKFLGRRDNQVKIGGYRIELGEIEKNLLSDASVQNAVVTDIDDDGGKYLCAYIVTDDEIDAERLKKLLSNKLPDYMVPDIFVKIPQLPLTANGKVNKKALPVSGKKSAVSKAEPKAPRNLTDDLLCGMWEETLNIDRVAINDNFYSLGGHSILMISIIAKIEKKLHVKIGYKEFIDNCTVEQLSDLISTKTKKNTFEYPVAEINAEDIYKPFPLTQVQMAYLIGRNKSFDLGGVSTHMYTELENGLDMTMLSVSLNKTIERHPMLRAIVKKSGEQVILEKVPEYVIKVEDISGLDDDTQQKMILKKRQSLSSHIFEADKWPLFNFEAFRFSDNRNYLFVEFDQLIADGMSIQIITKDLIDFYNSPDMPVKNADFTFRDYMVAYEKFKNSEKYNEDKDYWLSKLDEFPQAPALHLKRNAERAEKLTFNRLTKVFSERDWESLKERAKEYMVSPSALLCSVYAKVLSIWSNQKRLALNLTVFNRYPFHRDINKIVGDFTSVILLDIDTDKGRDFAELGRSVQNVLLDALEHRHYDGIEYIRQIAKRDNVVNKPVMPVVFTSMLFGDSDNADSHKYNAIGERKYVATQTSQVYLDHQANDSDNRLTLTWDYVSEMFDEESISAMFSQYIACIADIINGKTIFAEYLSQDDRKLIERYNKTEAKFSYRTLPQLFCETVKRCPSNISIIDDGREYSYADLDRLSDRAANYFVSLGIGKNDRVTVLCHRRFETIYTVLGALKAGAAYIPVDPGYPQSRIDFIMKNSGSKTLVDSSEIGGVINDYPDVFGEKVNDDIDSLAYIIYTSGSTGEPKGVKISHKAVVNTILDINGRFKVTEKDRIAGISSMCFDLSVYDIFGAFCSGAALVIVPDQRDVKGILSLVKKHNITIWNSVPAIINMAVEYLGSSSEKSYAWEESSAEDTKMEKVYFWSPIVQWKTGADGVLLGGEEFNGKIYSELMPELYFFAQDGVTVEQIKNKFNDKDRGDLENAISTLIENKVLVSGILKPEELFASQDRLFRHNYGTDLLFKADVYKKFKLKQLSRSLRYNGSKTIKLEDNFKLPDALTNRQSCREFDKETKIPFSTFSMILNAFKQTRNGGRNTYFYASAGGLYPIDVFVYVKEDRVENVDRGLYYYNPINNRLVLVNGKDHITADAHYFTNKAIFQGSAFSVFFTYNAGVTMPRYGGAGYLYSLIDTGIMVSTLTQVCEELNIGLCSIGDMNFGKIEPLFGFKDNQVHIHTVECGIKAGGCAVAVSKRLAESNLSGIESLRLVMMSGDWIPLDLPEKIKACFVNTEMISLGGATEASIWSIFHRIYNVDPKWNSIPYGAPLANQSIYILNDDCNLVPVNVLGEIYIGGAGVSDGYVNDEPKNRNSFINHKRFGRLYKTGDYGIMRSEGYVEFMGRKDSQIKINGFRVELEEIETKMRRLDGIGECVAAMKSYKGNTFIIAYYVADGNVAKDDLRLQLEKSLPSYMIPKYFVPLDNIRLTANGKVDRKTLPEFEISDAVEKTHDVYVKPESGIEKFICHLVEEILDIEKVGLENDFFEMNGDSLKATRLISRLQQELEVDIGYEIFANSKIKDIIGFVIKKKPDVLNLFSLGLDSIILLRKGKENGRNLFLFGDIRGEVDQYMSLCNSLDETYTCYGIRTEPDSRITAKEVTIEKLSGQLVHEIMKIQSSGEYCVAGWSFGGIVAYETARQLSTVNKIRFVGIIDSLQPGGDIDEKFDFSLDAEKFVVAQYVSKEIGENAGIANAGELWESVISYFESDADAFERFKNSFGELSFIIQSDIPRETVKRFNLFRTLSNAQSKYRPSGKIAATGYLFNAKSSFINMSKDAWDQYFDSVKSYSLDADHMGAIQKPCVDIVAGLFNKDL